MTANAVILNAEPLLPVVELSRSAIDFSGVRVGETSGAQNITITNTGTAALSLGSLTISGVQASEFGITADNCPAQTLDISAPCSVSVVFSPDATELRSAQLNIPSNAVSSPDSVGLSGTGIESVVSLTLETLNFGMLPPGESAQQILTITNNGEADLNLFEITDPGPPFAIVAGEPQGGIQPCTIPSVLAPGASCTLTVEFAPQTSRGGSFEASFEIRSDAANSPTTITLRASAEAIPVPIFDRSGLLLLIVGMLLLAFFGMRRNGSPERGGLL